MKNKIDLKESWELREKAEIERLRASLEKNAKDPSLHYEIGRIPMRRWGSKEREWGIKHLQQAVKLKKDFTEAIELLAIEATDTDHNKAIRLYKKAANIYEEQGNKEKAEELLDVYFYLGDKKNAEKYYKEYGEHEGAYNYALLLFSMKEKTKAINLLKESSKTVPFVAIILRAYLKMFKFWQERRLFYFGETPPLFMHRNAVINAWNENIKLAKDYITNRNLEAAYDFCNLYGPLWLRQKGSYIFLLEGMDAAS